VVERIRVLIVDDHPIVRRGLVAFLQAQPDIEVLAEAADGEEAVRQVGRTRPDIVLMDLVMPKSDGIESTARIRELSPESRVIVLTSFADDEKIFAAVRAGASGYLMKDVEPQRLAEAIRTVHSGDALLDPAVTARLMGEFARQQSRASFLGALTARETEVLRLLGRGMSNKEIALELSVAEKTVKTHVSNVLQKLQLADRTQAALFAVRERLVDAG